MKNYKLGMNKIKVCHFSSVHSVNDNRIFQKECTSLASHGYDVTYIAFGEESYTTSKNGVSVESLYLNEHNRLLQFLKRSRLLYKKIIEVDADIYHFHDPELLPMGLRLKKKGKKVIFDSHEFYGEQIKTKTYIPAVLRKLFVFIYLKYEAYVCRRLDAVVQVCTLQGKNYFEGRAIRTEMIANTPRKKNFSDSDVQSGYKGFESRGSVIYVGSLTRNRGIANIVNAINLSKIPLILGGKFYSDKFQTELKQLEGYQYVDFKGYVREEEVMNLCEQSFAGLSLLRHVNQYHKIDTLPTKVFDYMAAGIPTVMSDTDYAKKINQQFNIGICVDPDNFEQISEAINKLHNDKSLAEMLGKNAKYAYENLFNWDIEEAKLIDLYQKIR